MKTRPLFIAPVLLLASLVACGDGGGAKTAKVAAGPMPEGESWSGVYFNEIYGYLHVQEEGTNVVGKWKTKTGDRCGTLSGTFKGNLLHFTWKEHTIGMVGAAADKKGRGYFVYKMDDENRPQLKGEFGLNDEEVGSRWDSMKQPRLSPDLKSIDCAPEGVSPSAF